MKNKILILSAAILLSVSPTLSGKKIPNIIASNSIIRMAVSGISLEEVQTYMSKYGIYIVGISTIDGSENVYARDDKGNNYIIYVTNGIINGWDPFDI